MTVCSSEPLLPLSQAYIKTWLCVPISRKTQNRMENNEGPSQTKTAVTLESERLARSLIELERNDLRKVIGYLLGILP